MYAFASEEIKDEKKSAGRAARYRACVAVVGGRGVYMWREWKNAIKSKICNTFASAQGTAI